MDRTTGYCAAMSQEGATPHDRRTGGDRGARRVGRLMHENGIKILRTQKCKATTNSNHAFNTAPNLLDQGFTADSLSQKCPLGISRCGYPVRQ
jgi:transposase InsO family protein